MARTAHGPCPARRSIRVSGRSQDETSYSPKGGRGNCCASASGSGHDRGGADRDAKCRNRRASRSPLVSPKISLAADDTQQRPRASPTPTSAYVPMHGRVCSCSESTAQQTSMTAVRARAGQRRRPRWGDRYRRNAIAVRQAARRSLSLSRERASDDRKGDEAQVRDRRVLAAGPMASKRPQA